MWSADVNKIFATCFKSMPFGGTVVQLSEQNDNSMAQ